MPLTAGTRIGSYDIVSPLGSGAMGEVYRARDTKLGREVAIKILPAEFAADPDRLARFEREARLLAALNHPNIAAIYGVEDTGSGGDAIVQEFVDGATLAEKLGQAGQAGETGQVRRVGNALPIPEALAIARQIADALDAAHEKGIIHRDLKPANIKMTADGVVKVLDFGLARAIARPELTVSEAPTQMSHVGMIVGTAAYMSPEQARGLAVDKRTDIWAFGCVVYEMLTGKQAFAGRTMTDVMVTVLEREPDWSALPGATPANVRRLLERCLQKDPRNRLRDIGDARIEMDVSGGATASEPVSAPSAARRNERIAWIVALTAVSTIAIVLARFASERQLPGAPEMRVEITTPSTTDPVALALSPDGRQIAFVAISEGRSLLWVRSLDSGSARPLAGTDSASYPFWSPDSRSIGFFADSHLRRIDVEDGSVRQLASVALGDGGAWNLEGTILFTYSPGSPLMRVSANGGPSAPATRLDLPRQTGHGSPQFLPDGRHFICHVKGSAEARGVYVGQLDSFEIRRLFDADSSAVFVSPGHLLFVRQGTLVAHAFDPVRLTLTGNPFPVAERVIGDIRQIPALSASAVSSIAYRAGSWVARRQFVWFDRSGREIGTVGEPDSNYMVSPEISRDGKRIAVHRQQGGTGDVWLLDVGRGVLSRSTSNPANDIFPVWSPDGRRLVFSSSRRGPYDLYTTSPEGGPETLLLANSSAKIPTDWSVNGHLLFNQTGTESGDIWVLRMEGAPTPSPVAQSGFDERDGQFSPDGKWIAFQSNESGRWEIYVQPFPGPGGKKQISNNGGAQVRWRADGQELFYIALDGRFMAVPIQFGPAAVTVEAGAPVPLFVTRIGGALQVAIRPQYVVSPDGQRLLMNTIVEEPTTPITLLLNWNGESAKK
jgi:serine/threonine protein kinase